MHPHLSQYPALTVQDADHLGEGIVAVDLQAAGNLGNPMQGFGEQPVPEPEGLFLFRGGSQQFHPERRFPDQDRIPRFQRAGLAKSTMGVFRNPL